MTFFIGPSCDCVSYAPVLVNGWQDVGEGGVRRGRGETVLMRAHRPRVRRARALGGRTGGTAGAPPAGVPRNTPGTTGLASAAHRGRVEFGRPAIRRWRTQRASQQTAVRYAPGWRAPAARRRH